MPGQTLTLDIAGQTDIGLKRKRNEDFLAFRVPEPDSPEYRLGGAVRRRRRHGRHGRR